MQKICIFALTLVMVAVSCQKEVAIDGNSVEPTTADATQSVTRSYDEALAIAEDALKLLEGDDTRSAKQRSIKRDEGQIVYKPTTRGTEADAEPIMYVFNNENNEGFTVVAANRSIYPLIAVVESGNYTYGEPTGVEPFDLLMEDVTNTLSILPEEDLAIKHAKENEVAFYNTNYNSNNIQWGTGGIYGSLYPDGVAFDEATAIAQAVVCSDGDTSYTVSIPNHQLNGQSVQLNKTLLKRYIRSDLYFASQDAQLLAEMEESIALLYLEIGHRLINGTSISLSNKRRTFSVEKVQSVIESFGCDVGYIYNYNESTANQLTMRSMEVGNRLSYFNDIIVLKGYLSNYDEFEDSSYERYWLATNIMHLRYDWVTYVLDATINPNHPKPNEYTEINRVKRNEMFLFMNWGFDGYNNGWFNIGCFDMTARSHEDNLFSEQPVTYDYNFEDIDFFSIENGI